jgi:hypothetical protein
MGGDARGVGRSDAEKVDETLTLGVDNVEVVATRDEVCPHPKTDYRLLNICQLPRWQTKTWLSAVRIQGC